jgi:hypothetical protein
MSADLFSKFKVRLKQTESQLLRSVRLVPLVLLYSGAIITRGKRTNIRIGEQEADLVYGDGNLWFLTQWVSWSGGDSLPVGKIPPGFRITKVKAYAKGLDKTLPPRNTTASVSFDRKSGLAQVEISNGEGTVRAADYLGASEEVNLYDVFSSDYRFETVDEKMVNRSKMPLLPVPLTPFEIVKGETVYKRSELDGDDDRGIGGNLMDAGYVFYKDTANRLIYYSNSLAVFLGAPPTASAIGLGKLLLKSFPDGDYYQVLENGLMDYEVGRKGGALAKIKTEAGGKKKLAVN